MKATYKTRMLYPACIAVIQIFFCVMPVRSADTPFFKVDATAALLLEAHSGQVVFEQNARQTIPPASLVKLMTLYLAYDALQAGSVGADDRVLISEKAWQTRGSKMFVEVDSRVRLQKLLEGIASISGNDACVAVAEHLAGLEEAFVVKMNEKAHLLGMDKTHFENVNGLPAKNQFTTASDIGTLAYHYLTDHPEALKIHSIKQFTFGGITQYNRNGLLWLDEGVDGLKTGWINDDAGYHLVATAARDGQRFIAVVMGARNQRSRENEALKLLNYGFRNFTTQTLVSLDEPVAAVPVWKGTVDQAFLMAAEPGIVTVPSGEEQGIILAKKLPRRILAPVSKGTTFGSLDIVLSGKSLKTIDLIAQHDVPSGNLIKRLFHMGLLSLIVPPYWGWIVLILLFLVVVLAAVAMRRNA